jgi:molecular chaperone GrpE
MVKKKIKVKEEKKDKTKDLNDQLVRVLADYDNLSKRYDREKEEFTKIAHIKLVARLLPVLDMIEQAQEYLKDPGLAIATKEFIEVFNDEGIETIDSEAGIEFNEEYHDAVEVVDGGKEGKIAETVLGGWKFEDNIVIRPAKVKVYKGGKKQ